MFFHPLVSFPLEIIKDIHKDTTMRPNYSIIFDGNNRDWSSQLWNTYEVKYFMSNVIVYLLPMKHVADLLFKREKKKQVSSTM